MQKKIFIFSVYILIFICVVLPTGLIFDFKVKVLFSVISIFLFILDFIFSPYFNKRLLISTIYFFCFLFFYFILTLLNGNDYISAFSQLNALTATVLLIILPMHLIYKKYVSTSSMLVNIIFYALIYSSIKIILEFLYIIHILSTYEIVYSLTSIFGYEPIYLEFSGFLRINLPSDFLLPILLLVVAARKYLNIQLNSYFSIFCATNFLGSIFIAYSRYLWFLSFFAILISCYYAFENFNFKKNKRKFLLFFFGAAILVSIALLILMQHSEILNPLTDLINDRYTGSASEQSDSIRITMQQQLLDQFFQFPILGSGLGAYPHDYIRFPELPWNYELQWLALVMQFGIFGISIILLYLCRFLIFILKMKYPMNIFLCLLFTIWLSTGFFNCFLITSSAGVLYLIFIVISLSYDKNLYQLQGNE
jgi:hypothetical protein